MEARLIEFVRTHEGIRQHDQSWYDVMKTTVGGSELAALMGCNPYSKFADVVANKRAGNKWNGGGPPCWWGTLFEDVINAYVTIDLGRKIHGDDICVQVISGHRNSPDGYIIAQIYSDTDGDSAIWTTDLCPTIPTVEQIVLLEFKCPISRKPLGSVPPQYMPQVWSGLAVSPLAHFGLYVDAVFRKCALSDLGGVPGYDTVYHSRDTAKGSLSNLNRAPVAWGLVAIYAPMLSAPRHVRLGWHGESWAPGDPNPDSPDADASLAAWQIKKACGEDVGSMDARHFHRVLGLINRKRFLIQHASPWFADGRGQESSVDAVIDDLKKQAPMYYELVSILPWKLIEVHYIPVDRRIGFLEEIIPLIAEVHAAVAAPVVAGTAINTTGDEVQDLFDSIV